MIHRKVIPTIMSITRESTNVNVREAVAYLTERGYPCSHGTVRALVKARKLLCYRPGVTEKGPMSFTAARLDDFLQRAETGAGGSEAGPGKDKSNPERKPRVTKSVAVGTVATPDWREKLKRELGT